MVNCHQQLWRAEESCCFDLPQQFFFTRRVLVLEALSQHPYTQAILWQPKEMLEHNLSPKSLPCGAFHNG